MPCPVASVPMPRWARSTQSRDGRGFFETRRLLGCPDEAKGTPLLEHRWDTKQDTKQGNRPMTPIHRERPLGEVRWPSRDHGVRLPFAPGELAGSRTRQVYLLENVWQNRLPLVPVEFLPAKHCP